MNCDSASSAATSVRNVSNTTSGTNSKKRKSDDSVQKPNNGKSVSPNILTVSDVPTLKKSMLELREENKMLERKCLEAEIAQKKKLEDKIREYRERKKRLEATLKEMEVDILDDGK